MPLLIDVIGASLAFAAFFGAPFQTTNLLYEAPATVRRSAERLYVQGVITQQTLLDFRAAIHEHGTGPPKVLIVTSPGGEGFSSLQIAELVRELELRMEVPVLCASACAVYLLPAAKHVTIRPNAIVALHNFPSAAVRDGAVDRIGAGSSAAKFWASSYNRLLGRQRQLFAILGISEIGFINAMTIWQRTNALLRKEGVLVSYAEVDLAVGKAFLTNCIGVRHLDMIDYSPEDSILFSRNAGGRFAFVAGDAVFYRGTKVLDLDNGCAAG